MKKCRICKRELPLSQFHKHSKSLDGLHHFCKECKSKLMHDRYLNDGDRIREGQIRRRKENLIESLRKEDDWRQKNKEKLKRQRIERNIKTEQNFPRLRWCRHSIYSHKRSGFEVRITPDELRDIVINIDHCHICNRPLSWESFLGTGSYGPKDTSPNLDRKNNENYIDKNNFLIICWKCNITKQDRTWKEFIQYCKDTYLKFKTDIE